VVTSARRIWFHFSETWPFRDLWCRAYEAATAVAEQLRQVWQTVRPAVEPPLLM
jgi:hypothetical protein